MSVTKLSVADQIRRTIHGGKLPLPPLPELANRLMELVRNEDSANTRQIATLVQNDPAIAGSILRLANAAAFGGLGRVTDLGEAVARLGLRQVSALVTTVVHRGHFQTRTPSREARLRTLWDHAVVTGLGAKHLTIQAGGDRTDAYLAGLMHDIGKLAVLRAMDQIEADSKESFELAVLDDAMETLHPAVGEDLLTTWRLPEHISSIARHHHDAPAASTEPLLLRVMAANAMARKLGAHLRPDPELDLGAVPAIEQLGLSEIDVASVLVDVEDEFTEIRSLF